MLPRLPKYIRDQLPATGRDVVGLVGFGLLVYGVWLIHRPSAYIVAGAGLLFASLILARGE